MPELAPEAKARQQIDVLLTGAGWVLQDYDRFDASVARYIALREIPVRGGRCDYLLLAARRPIGVVEAKKAGTVTIDALVSQGFDAAAKDKAASLVTSFRAYIEEHRAEIAALQILYSRPYKQRLTESMLKELECKLRDTNAAWNEEILWKAFATAAPEKVKGRSAVNRFADLVPLVRFALAQQPMLEPFAESVGVRFERWISEKASAGVTFDDDQRAWLELIRDHIATSLSIEPEDFEFSPFNQHGGLGRAAQLFGDGLAALLDDLNGALAA